MTEQNDLKLPVKIPRDSGESLRHLITAGIYNENILNNLSSNIIITDRDFNITYTNPAAQKSLGYSRETVLGKNLFELGAQYGLGLDLKNNLGAVMEKGESFHVKAIQYLNPAKEVRYFDLVYMPLMNERKEIVGIISVGDDVTRRIADERKKLPAPDSKQMSNYQEWELTRAEFENQISKLEDQLKESRAKIDFLQMEVESNYKIHNIIARNRNMLKILDLIPRIAESDSSALINGETGTGKELIAKAIHYNSFRKERQFIAINCAALTETLLESELFGHVKGSFTGAIRDKAGKFELADGGTLFLDEVGEMAPVTQSKLLRVLQEHELTRVGGERNIKVNVRIIAATNRDLEDLISQGKFRRDLYYRLKVIPINLPPLRERMDDVPLLAAYFLKKYSQRQKKKITSISQAAMNKMLSYSWPGNIRELENLIEQTVALASGDVIDDVDLPDWGRKSISPVIIEHAPLDLGSYLDSCERDYLFELLRQFNGNIKQVSQISGLNRRSIFNKMKKYNLSKEDFKHNL